MSSLYARSQIETLRSHGVGLALLVERHDDDAGAVAAHAARLLEELLLALLERDRVDDALALDALEAGLEHRPARAVDHDRDARDLGLGRDEVEERRHRLLAVEQVGVHVHVEEVRAAAHLLERDVERLLHRAALDEAAEAGRAGDVRPLADEREVRDGVVAQLERLHAAEARRAARRGNRARRDAVDRGDDLPDVLGRRAAAAADDVDEAVARELAEEAARVLRLLVVLAERVRQAGVRMARDPRRRDLREILDERPHLGAAERAVDADDERLRVLDRDPERLDGLRGEVPAAAVDRGEREPERQLGRGVLRGEDRGLAVERVEDRLDEEQVDAAVAQRADLLRVRLHHLVERRRAVRRVVDARRKRERDI